MSYFMFFYKLFIINLFTFGGGYTILPVIKDEFIKENLITQEDLDNILAVAQSLPGVFVISVSFLLGYKLKGIKGAFIGVLASILPSFIIISIISQFYSWFIQNNYLKIYISNISISITVILFMTVINSIVKRKNRPFILILVLVLTFLLNNILKINLIFILIIVSLVSNIAIRDEL